MFSINVIKSCPVVEASQGILHFQKEHIAMIAGAARDSKIEWLAFLNGRRSDDGYEVFVEQLTIPQQERGGTHAAIAEQEIAADVVGVIHLHPWWSEPSFSGTDRNTLNPRFSSSIVVSPANNNLGFSYEAEGKVKLPCGNVGRAAFQVSVAGAGARFANQPVRADHNTVGRDAYLGDCDQHTSKPGRYENRITAACGVTMTADRPAVFGLNGSGFLETVAKMTVHVKKPVGQGYQRGKAGFTNGLQKLYGPGGKYDDGLSALDMSKINRSGKYTTKGGCDECEIRGEMLRWHVVTEAWYCRDCYVGADALIAQAMGKLEQDGGVSYADLVAGDAEAGEKADEGAVMQLADGSIVVTGH
jgi:hypothetical protein